MNPTTIDIGTLATFISLLVTVFMQGFKLVIELIPGITLARNKTLHDWLIRIAQYALNFGLLVLVAHTIPATFAGLYWWDLLSIAFGQGVISHVTYAAVSQGGSPTIPDLPAPATIQGAPLVQDASGLPVIPRG